MSATDELRRLLDERGVKYWDMKTRGIWFGINADGSDHSYEAYDQTNSLIEIATFDLTTEQAIAATLGAGTCHVKAAEKIGDLFGFSLSCGHSMVNPFNDHPDYCPWCGRKVVDE